MTLTVTLNNIPTEDFPSVTSDGAQLLMIQKLDVCIESVSGQETAEDEICPNNLRYRSRSGDETSDDDLTDIYYMDFVGTELVKDDNEEEYDLTISLKIASTDSTDIFSTENTVSIEYDDPNDGEVSTTATAVAETPVATEPAGLESASQNRGVVVYWTDPSSVTFADGSTGSPEGVRTYLIKANVDRSLNITTTYSEDDSPVEEDLDNCTLDVELAGKGEENSCTFTCSDRAYLNPDRLSTYTDIQYLETTSSATSFADLDILTSSDDDQAYAVLAQFLPDGLLQSAGDGTYTASCSIAYPTENYTYAQLTGADDPTQKDPTCFIATAAYGHPIHGSLDELRWFRDTVLGAHSWGQSLVDTYYEYSPSLAREIAVNESYKTITRGALWVPVKYIHYLRTQTTLTIIASILLATFALSASVSFLFKKAQATRL